MQDYLQVFIPYVLQKVFDFSEFEYDEVKKKMGNGVMIDFIADGLELKDGVYPRVATIVDKAKVYLDSVEIS